MRRQLFALVASVILLSGVVLVLILASLRVQAVRTGERLTESFAHVIAEQTNNTLHTVDLRLQLAASHITQLTTVGRLSEGAGRELLREEIKALPFVRALSVADAQGRIVYTSDRGAPGWSVADREYFQIYREERQTGFYVGVPVRGRVSGAWLISATRPLRLADGAFGGVLVAAVEPAYFDQLWSEVDLGAGGSIALFRRDGLLMMRSPFDDSVMGKSFADRPLFTVWVPARPEGTFQDASPIDGIVRMLAYRTLAGNHNLVVVVGRSRELVLASWRQVATIALSIWALASLSIATLGVFLDKAWLQRARTEASVEQMAQRLVMATDAASVGVWDWDLKADRWYATPTYFAMLGYEPDQGVGPRQQWLDHVHPEDRDVVAANIQAALAGADVPYRHDARVLHSDGSYRWMSVIGRVLARDATGKPSRLLGVMMDITESKRSEQALRESEAFSLSILDSVVVEIAVLNADGMIIAVNDPWQRFAVENGVEPGRPAPHTGIGANYLAVCDGAEGMSSDDAVKAAEGIRGVLAGKLPAFRLDYACHSPTEQRWFTMSATPLEPDRRGVVVAHVNITQRMRADEALRSSIREKEALLKEVHHRVKNNLQVITSLLRLEISRSTEIATRGVLTEMQGRIRSMALLHETLYRTGRFARVDLANYLRQLATQLFRAQNTAPGAVRLELDLRSLVVDIDQAIPCGLIVNELLTNSLKHAFGPGGGELRVRIGADADGWARLEVSDSGPGLPPDFEARRGASLGLQLVSDLARQLGGVLEIGPESVPRFAVRFPLRYLDTGPIVLSTG